MSHSRRLRERYQSPGPLDAKPPVAKGDSAATPPGVIAAGVAAWFGVFLLFVCGFLWIVFAAQGFIPAFVMRVTVAAAVQTLCSMGFGLWRVHQSGQRATNVQLAGLIVPGIITVLLALGVIAYGYERTMGSLTDEAIALRKKEAEHQRAMKYEQAQRRDHAARLDHERKMEAYREKSAQDAHQAYLDQSKLDAGEPVVPPADMLPLLPEPRRIGELSIATGSLKPTDDNLSLVAESFGEGMLALNLELLYPYIMPLVWSHSGDYVYCCSSNGDNYEEATLLMVRTSDWKVIKRLKPNPNLADGFGRLAMSRKYLLAGHNGALLVMDPATLNVHYEITAPGSPVACPAHDRIFMYGSRLQMIDLEKRKLIHDLYLSHMLGAKVFSSRLAPGDRIRFDRGALTSDGKHLFLGHSEVAHFEIDGYKVARARAVEGRHAGHALSRRAPSELPT